MDIEVTFPGGARVDANYGPYTIATDQPPLGGGVGSAPTPFALFLASIGTCAGIYVLGFLKQRGLSTEGVKLIQKVGRNPQTGMVEQVGIEIIVPEDFPPQYHSALIKTAELCAVKKHLDSPPQFDVQVVSRAL